MSKFHNSAGPILAPAPKTYKPRRHTKSITEERAIKIYTERYCTPPPPHHPRNRNPHETPPKTPQSCACTLVHERVTPWHTIEAHFTWKFDKPNKMGKKGQHTTPVRNGAFHHICARLQQGRGNDNNNNNKNKHNHNHNDKQQTTNNKQHTTKHQNNKTTKQQNNKPQTTNHKTTKQWTTKQHTTRKQPTTNNQQQPTNTNYKQQPTNQQTQATNSKQQHTTTTRTRMRTTATTTELAAATTTMTNRTTAAMVSTTSTSSTTGGSSQNCSRLQDKECIWVDASTTLRVPVRTHENHHTSCFAFGERGQVPSAHSEEDEEDRRGSFQFCFTLSLMKNVLDRRFLSLNAAAGTAPCFEKYTSSAAMSLPLWEKDSHHKHHAPLIFSLLADFVTKICQRILHDTIATYTNMFFPELLQRNV